MKMYIHWKQLRKLLLKNGKRQKRTLRQNTKKKKRIIRGKVHEIVGKYYIVTFRYHFSFRRFDEMSWYFYVLFFFRCNKMGNGFFSITFHKESRILLPHSIKAVWHFGILLKMFLLVFELVARVIPEQQRLGQKVSCGREFSSALTDAKKYRRWEYFSLPQTKIILFMVKKKVYANGLLMAIEIRLFIHKSFAATTRISDAWNSKVSYHWAKQTRAKTNINVSA